MGDPGRCFDIEDLTRGNGRDTVEQDAILRLCEAVCSGDVQPTSVAEFRHEVDAIELPRHDIDSPIVSLEEFLSRSPPEWRIENILPEGLSVLVGLPESGKSFLAFDWGLSVATEEAWQGHDVQRGRVLYVAAERQPGLVKRALAWLDRVPIGLADVSGWFDLCPEAVEFHKPQSTRRFLGWLRGLPHEPDLIIVDTLMKCLVDGDVNAQKDMSAFCHGLETVRRETGASIVIVHHTAKDGQGYLGSVALAASADAMFRVKKNGTTIVVSVEKMSDFQKFDPIEMKLHEVSEHESCVLIRSVEDGNESKQEKEQWLVILRLLFRLSPEEMISSSDLKVTWLNEVGARRNEDFYKLLEQVEKKGYVETTGKTKAKKVRLTEEGKAFLDECGHDET